MKVGIQGNVGQTRNVVAIVKVVAIMVSNGLDGQKPVELNQRVKKVKLENFTFHGRSS